jgi:hypothetical protein
MVTLIGVLALAGIVFALLIAMRSRGGRYHSGSEARLWADGGRYDGGRTYGSGGDAGGGDSGGGG